MKAQETLRPVDVVVALALALTPEQGFEDLAESVGIGLSSAHRSVRRLQSAGIVLPHRRASDIPALLDFLIHGAPRVFYPQLGPEAPGVPTAHAGPLLAEEITSDRAAVWPTAGGSVRGESLVPLYPGAVELPERHPELYGLLTLVDALRIGRARERSLAARMLNEQLSNLVA
jgi:hypothetical protein